ncbi:MAG: transcriptional regulator [Rhodobacteraceae bacterium]|nr:transcriptional regulator [Paracoccaceae bacterium]
MKGYGQFCFIAKALEIVGERWTPLILRELMCGATRFSDLQRGLPRLSPSLLSRRLGALARSGVVCRTAGGGYALTPAGAELRPVIEALGFWGQRWVGGSLAAEDYDPDVLMWDMRRRIAQDQLPPGRTCICFAFRDAAPDRQHYWLLAAPQQVDLCITDPGVKVDLLVATDVRTMVQVWNGDCPLGARLRDGSIDLQGPRPLVAAFPGWLRLSLFAAAPPAGGAG